MLETDVDTARMFLNIFNVGAQFEISARDVVECFLKSQFILSY